MILRFPRGNRAKVFGAVLIMASTFAVIGSPTSLASAESSIPSFLDPTKLPICEKPGPNNSTSAAPKSIHDPTAYHCAMTPARGGLNLKGVDNNKFLRLDSTNVAKFERDNGGGPADGPNLDACAPNCRNGILEAQASGQRQGVGSRLQAQGVTLRANNQIVYNWVGLQNLDQVFNGQLVQIGIIVNSWPASYCAENKNQQNRPLIVTQARIDGRPGHPGFTPRICFPGYIFGVGSHTHFAVTDNGGGWWNLWVNWADQWHAILGFHVPNLKRGNAVGVTEAAEVKVQSGQPDPFIGVINDKQIELNWGGADWRQWSEAVPTQVFNRWYCFNRGWSINEADITAFDC